MIVFSPDSSDFPTSNDDLYYNYWSDQIQEFQRRFVSRLRDADTVADCVAKANQIGLTSQVLDDYVRTIRQFMNVRNKEYEKQVDQAVEPVAEMDSEVRIAHIKSYQDILTAVAALGQSESDQAASRGVELVLIFHGGMDGSLEDLGGMMIPPSFFEDLTQYKNIRRIAVYACYPNEILQFYHAPFAHLHSQGVSIRLGVNQGVMSEVKGMLVNQFRNFLEKDLAEEH